MFRERGTEYAFRHLRKQAFFYFFCNVTEKLPQKTSKPYGNKCFMGFSTQRRKGDFTMGLMAAWTAFIQAPGVKSEENCGGKSAHTVCASSLFL